ncbi:MAG: PfkB family carbohydrate kinase [Gemmatimonadota bacterium]
MGSHIAVAPGSINIDLILKTDVLRGPKTFRGDYTESQGGKGSNQAVAARLASDHRREVYLLGCVGRDAWGAQALDKLRAAGVNTELVRVTEACRTGVVMEYLYGDGEVTIGLGLGANGEVTVADVEGAGEVIGSAVVHLCQIESPIAAVERALSLARAGGAATVLDPSVVPAPGPDRDRLFERLLPLVDVLAPNRSEAQALTGVAVDGDASAREAAAALLRHAPVALITRGRDGALVARGSQCEMVRGLRVDALDGGAAGDTFRGAFCAALAEALQRRGGRLADLAFSELVAAAELANAAAALCVTRPGAYPSIPGREEIEVFRRTAVPRPGPGR